MNFYFQTKDKEIGGYTILEVNMEEQHFNLAHEPHSRPDDAPVLPEKEFNEKIEFLKKNGFKFKTLYVNGNKE